MIRANTRGRLTARDLTMVTAILSRGSDRVRSDLESLLHHEGPDALLDQPSLLGRLVECRSIMTPSPALFVYVLIRYHLLNAGFTDRDLADYLSALVLDFGAGDRACRIVTGSEDRHEYLVDLLARLDSCSDEERFLTLAHLGNYSLWLSGLFPDRIVAQRNRRGGPGLGYYDSLGRRGFAAASDHRLAAGTGLSDVYRTAAESFPSLRATFNRISDRIFFPDVNAPDRIIRELRRSSN